jgi:hypothetical protein
MEREAIKAIIMALMCPYGINVVHNDLAIANLAENADNILEGAGYDDRVTRP